MGLFLRNAIGKGWELFGVEPSPTLSRIARDRFKLNVKTAFLEEAKFPSEFFDIVCLTDVFEHIKEPKQLLLEIHRILLRGGIVYINVPNGRFNLFKLILARCFRRTHDYNLFDSYEHVVHYTHETLVRVVGDMWVSDENRLHWPTHSIACLASLRGRLLSISEPLGARPITPDLAHPLSSVIVD